MNCIFLDTETTGKDPHTAECLSVAIIDYAGTVLLDTLVRPVRTKAWPDAQAIHGITPAQALRPELPTLAELTPRIAELLRGREVVIYNAGYDTTTLAAAFAHGEPAAVHCAMLAFSEHPEVRVWNSHHGNYRWQSLATATDHVGHQWRGQAHGALADCYAARDVWAWLTDPAERARLQAEAAARREAKELAWHVRDVLAPIERAEQERLEKAGRAWERAHYPAMGVCERRNILPECLNAERSADVFCLAPLGTTARAWNRYGKLLKLPRYLRTQQPLPDKLTSGDEVYLLPGAKLPPPAGLLIYADKADALPHEWLDAKPLYRKRSLRQGIHFVPHLPGYEPWPAGHYSKTTLQKQFKLKPAEIDAIRPAYLRVVKSGKYYENQYLLYPYTAPTDEKSS
jgi:DNA polymerase-3 subunit epsilon